MLSGDLNPVRRQLNELRLHMGSALELRDPKVFKPLWVVDFPLLEWDEDIERYHAMHHPFTSPKPEHFDLIDSDPGAVRANAYDMSKFRRSRAVSLPLACWASIRFSPPPCTA